MRRNDAMKAHFQPVADDCMVSMGWEVKVPIREVKARTSPAPCSRKRAARPAEKICMKIQAGGKI